MSLPTNGRSPGMAGGPKAAIASLCGRDARAPGRCAMLVGARGARSPDVGPDSFHAAFPLGTLIVFVLVVHTAARMDRDEAKDPEYDLLIAGGGAAGFFAAVAAAVPHHVFRLPGAQSNSFCGLNAAIWPKRSA